MNDQEYAEVEQFTPSQNHWTLEGFKEKVTEKQLRYLLLERPDPIKHGCLREWEFKEVGLGVYKVWIGDADG